MTTQSICQFNKFGFCKFKEACRKQHVKESCELISCDGKICIQRHPKECSLFTNRGYCKFGEWCHFLHIVKKDPEMEKIKSENKEILKKLDFLEKLLFEKDKEIQNILKTIEESRNTKEKQISKSFKCTKCNFETNYQSGLKINEKKKHTSIEIEKYPRTCDLCDTELRNAAEMKKHIESFIQESKL